MGRREGLTTLSQGNLGLDFEAIILTRHKEVSHEKSFRSNFYLVLCIAPYRQHKLPSIVLTISFILTAERIATPLGEAPANVSIITKEDFEDSGARTITDVFDNEPGLTTSNLLGSPKRAQIDIRGYGEAAPQNVLFLVDGRRINSIDLSGTDLSQIQLKWWKGLRSIVVLLAFFLEITLQEGVVNIILRKGEGKPKVTLGATAGSYELYSLRFQCRASKVLFRILLSQRVLTQADTDTITTCIRRIPR